MVVDSTDRQRLGISREELHRMLAHEELSKACLLVFANKQVMFVIKGLYNIYYSKYWEGNLSSISLVIKNSLQWILLSSFI